MKQNVSLAKFFFFFLEATMFIDNVGHAHEKEVRYFFSHAFGSENTFVAHGQGHNRKRISIEKFHYEIFKY